MATRRYGISRGEQEFNVTEAVGAATAADNIEVTVDLAAGLEQQEVILALEKIQNHIISTKWPPA